MASTTGLAILAELAPSGILPNISKELGILPSQAGMLVGVYALASALGTIPLMSKTLKYNRKKLLQILLIIFTLTNIVIGFASSYRLILFCRLLGGGAAGLLWPMISAYGSKLVTEEERGGIIALIMSGATVGLVLGVPAMTYLGQQINWRAEFFAIAILAFLVLILSWIFLPSIPGEENVENQGIGKLLSNDNMQKVLLLTFMTITAYYCLYVFIAPLMEKIAYKGSVTQAQLIFGISSCISIFVSMKYIRENLLGLIFINIMTGLLAMGLFLLWKGNQGIMNVSLFLWGFGYGSLSSLFQATIAKRMPWGMDMGNAIHSSVFNISIMVGSALGGMILQFLQLKNIIYLALILFILSILVLLKDKRVFS